MRSIISTILSLSLCGLVTAQSTSSNIEWPSASTTNGITIQNSYPKGGPYKGSAGKNFNYSHLVFYTRVINETANPFEITIDFPADSIAIPGSPDTYVKLILPADTMTFSKHFLSFYGITDFDSFIDNKKPTRFQRTIKPKEECLFHVIAVFYQTVATPENRDRGGNRAELIMKGQDLFYRIPPTIDSLLCGQIISKR